MKRFMGLCVLLLGLPSLSHALYTTINTGQLVSVSSQALSLVTQQEGIGRWDQLRESKFFEYNFYSNDRTGFLGFWSSQLPLSGDQIYSAYVWSGELHDLL
jgi:hypothetical protein